MYRWQCDQSINTLMLGILRHAIMLFRNIIPEFNSQKEIHLIRIIDTTKKKKISFYDSSWMRAGIVITMSVLVPSIYMATFDVYPEKKNTMEICSNKATIIKEKIKEALIWETNRDINQTKFTHAKPFDMKANDSCSKFVRNEKPVIGLDCYFALFSI